MSPQPQWPEWFDLKTFAAYSKISERHLRALIRRGDLPHVKLGRLIRVHRPTFDAWMLAQSAPVRDATPPIPVVGLLDRIRASRPTSRRKFLVEDQRSVRDHSAHDVVVQFNARRIA